MTSRYSPSKSKASGSTTTTPQQDITKQEDFRRMQYKTALGFDPSISWSCDYAPPTSIEEKPVRVKTPTRSRTKTNTPSPFRRTTVDLDEFGNYVYVEKPTPSPRLARPQDTIRPASKSPKMPEEIRKLKVEQWKLKRINESLDLKCALCAEKIVEKETNFDRKFGLLPTCKDVFCLGCIIKRGRSSACPVCKTQYSNIIPCRFYVKCENQKQKMLDAIMEERKFFDDPLPEDNTPPTGWYRGYVQPFDFDESRYGDNPEDNGQASFEDDEEEDDANKESYYDKMVLRQRRR